ncbi:MAG: TetR/AcrR family transcriptional regulator [Acidimicrobiia bacterium]
MPNASTDVASRIAGRTLAARNAQYADEVRRLLDAGLVVMRRCGTSSSPRVADIVEEAGLSNDAFYRHFASKQALVTAILEDGTTRLAAYIEHQMAKGATPDAQVRRWQESGARARPPTRGRPDHACSHVERWGPSATSTAAAPTTASILAPLLHEPLTTLGSTDPCADATVTAHLVIGRSPTTSGSAPRRPARRPASADFVIRAVTPDPLALASRRAAIAAAWGRQNGIRRGRRARSREVEELTRPGARR